MAKKGKERDADRTVSMASYERVPPLVHWLISHSTTAVCHTEANLCVHLCAAMCKLPHRYTYVWSETVTRWPATFQLCAAEAKTESDCACEKNRSASSCFSFLWCAAHQHASWLLTPLPIPFPIPRQACVWDMWVCVFTVSVTLFCHLVRRGSAAVFAHRKRRDRICCQCLVWVSGIFFLPTNKGWYDWDVLWPFCIKNQWWG